MALLVGVAGVSLSACGDARDQTDGGSATSAPAPLQMPEDEGPHAVPLEWWYYTGNLTSAGGRKWGFQVAMFKRSTGTDLFLGNVAISDLQDESFFFTENVWFDAADSEGYAIKLPGWRLSGTGGHDRIAIDEGEHALDLTFAPQKPVVMHGGDGTLGSGQTATQYYSWPRLEVAGTLKRAGTDYEVSGLAWMDHQWFQRDVELGELQWDWFSIQLDNSVDVMLAILRDDAGDVEGGTWVDAAGEATELAAADFEVKARGEWTNPVSGNTYPMGWTVRIPSRELVLSVEPSQLDQELHGLANTPIDYWEGAVEASGTLRGAEVSGRGYVELTGYDR